MHRRTNWGVGCHQESGQTIWAVAKLLDGSELKWK